MTPGARCAAAIEVLDQWLGGTPVERALTGWARGARYAGSKDRAAVRDHVYDVLRSRGRCAQLGGADTGRGLILGLIRLAGAAPAAVFTGMGHAPSPLTGAEQPAPEGAPDIMLDTPAWLIDLLAPRYGDTLPAILAAMADRAPLFLRVNPRKADRDQAIEALSSDGIAATPVAAAPVALEVNGGARTLRQSAAYLGGWVEPQDLSVQIACAAIDWPQKGRVLDYCAGGGGKALAIAAISPAEILVHDVEPRRMADLPARAERAGVRLTPLATSGLAGSGLFDAVLCDVPCSGSGTWRRDPEARWRLTPERLGQLTVLQDTILDEAAALVAPGGRLIYMTCSLLEVENDARVQAFLDRQLGWKLTASAQDTPLSASDGFFRAELTHQATPA